MNTPGFIPFGEPANTTDEGREILAQIQPDEIHAANLTSRVLYERDVDQLDLQRLRFIWRGVKETRRERQQKTTPGTCCQCGCPVAADGIECRPCHEGMTPNQYSRAMSQYHLH